MNWYKSDSRELEKRSDAEHRVPWNTLQDSRLRKALRRLRLRSYSDLAAKESKAQQEPDLELTTRATRLAIKDAPKSHQQLLAAMPQLFLCCGMQDSWMRNGMLMEDCSVVVADHVLRVLGICVRICNSFGLLGEDSFDPVSPSIMPVRPVALMDGSMSRCTKMYLLARFQCEFSFGPGYDADPRKRMMMVISLT